MDYLSQLQMTILMTPDKANFGGNVHGGKIMEMLDQVAYTCCAKYCGRYVVTLSVDKIKFLKPIKVGELITFLAQINYTGSSSMEVGIKIIAENLNEKTVRHTNSAIFTMVAVDENNKPVSVPMLQVSTPEDKRRFDRAKKRLDEEKARRKEKNFSIY